MPRPPRIQCGHAGCSGALFKDGWCQIHFNEKARGWNQKSRAKKRKRLDSKNINTTEPPQSKKPKLLNESPLSPQTNQVDWSHVIKTLQDIQDKINKTELQVRVRPQNPKKLRTAIPASLKKALYQRDKQQGNVVGCFHCQEKLDYTQFECGHIKAVADGGDNSLANLIPVCFLCNRSVGKKNAQEFNLTNGIPQKNNALHRPTQ